VREQTSLTGSQEVVALSLTFEKLPEQIKGDSQAVLDWHLKRAFKARRALIFIFYEVNYKGEEYIQGCSMRLPKNDDDESFVNAIRARLAEVLHMIPIEALFGGK